MDPAQPDVLAKSDHDLARGLVVAADQHIAIDLVIEVAEMLRRHVLKRRDHAHLGAQHGAAWRPPRTGRRAVAPRSPWVERAARSHRPGSCRRAGRGPPPRSPFGGVGDGQEHDLRALRRLRLSAPATVLAAEPITRSALRRFAPCRPAAIRSSPRARRLRAAARGPCLARRCRPEPRCYNAYAPRLAPTSCRPQPSVRRNEATRRA